MSRILIIEDNDDLAFGLRTALRFEGYDVDVASDGAAGLTLADERPDLVVLDIMLPGMDGYAVLREMRRRGLHMPVLILTARDEETDVVMGFDCGADDYVTKPFSTVELLARARALLRRSTLGTNPGANGIVRFGQIEINPSTHAVRVRDTDVDLTPKEFDLLLALLGRNGATASRAELLKEVWRYGNADVMTRTVDIHIAELRRKLEADASKPDHILTVRKVGYRLKP
jgi:DNA-binding response OmpR family regulator